MESNAPATPRNVLKRKEIRARAEVSLAPKLPRRGPRGDQPPPRLKLAEADPQRVPQLGPDGN